MNIIVIQRVKTLLMLTVEVLWYFSLIFFLVGSAKVVDEIYQVILM